MAHFVRGHHGIFIPQYQDIIAPAARVGIAGYITAELIDAKTKHVKRKWSFKNLITNAGLDGLASFNGPLGSSTPALVTYCAVGTGTTAPTNTDTTLESEISTRTARALDSSTSYVSGSPDYSKGTQTYTFTESQANENLTEIGFFSASTAGTMFSRQLFKDESGDPTTVTKTSSDQLKITYELRIYAPADDVVSEGVDISGDSYDITVRPVHVDQTDWRNLLTGFAGWASASSGTIFYTGAMIGRTGSGSSSGVIANVSNTVAAYVSGNYYSELTAKVEPAGGSGNILTAAFFNSRYCFQMGFDPAIPKTNTMRWTLNFKTSWGRHT